MMLLLILTAFVAGLSFSLGLIQSGMLVPAPVLGFLDVTGAWSPGLAVVMATAIAVAAPAYFWVRYKHKTLLKHPSGVPRRRPPDVRLVVGSVVFGVGWGLSGLWPGSGLVLAGSGNMGAICFVLAMMAAMHVAFKTELYMLRRQQKRRTGKKQ